MLSAPPTERNKEPILEVLKDILPEGTSRVLEIASGYGIHVAHFAQALPNIIWQPTDVEENNLGSIRAYIDHQSLLNVRPPALVDVTKPISEWPIEVLEGGPYDAVICTNMIHITPWACSVGLFSAAGNLIRPNGLLLTYGPYAVNGVLSPESNVTFDNGLRSRNPEWGIRDIKDLEEQAQLNNLQLVKTVEMPANNKICVFKKNE